MALLLLGWCVSAYGQSKRTCLSFFDSTTSAHDRFECGEALFSEPSWHLTSSGFPPGNGLALGGEYELQTHYVTPYAPEPLTPLQPGEKYHCHLKHDPDHPFRPFAPTEECVPDAADAPSGKLSSTDVKVAVLGSTNGSWLATGSFVFVPGIYGSGSRNDRRGIPHPCETLLVFCTQSQLALRFEGTHRSLQTVSYYGLGPRSAAIKHTFHQNDTTFVSGVRLPLTDRMVLEGGLDLLQPDLPVTSDPLGVSRNFTDATAPGLSSQPFFAHPHVGLMVSPVFHSNPRTNDDDENRDGPLMKRNVRITLNNGAAYHWYTAPSNSADSFQQVIVRGDETIELATNVRRLMRRSDLHTPLSRLWYGMLLRNACGDGGPRAKGVAEVADPVVLKVHSLCNYGTVDFRGQLTASNTGSGSSVPFYLEPTVGGSDINSQVSLRGFPDYRFRDRDAVFVQTEYSVPIYDPVGLLLFYDAGTAGPNVSSLSFGRLRQDAGVGATLRVQGNVAAQAFLAWGAGHGPMIGYNFSKSF